MVFGGNLARKHGKYYLQWKIICNWDQYNFYNLDKCDFTMFTNLILQFGQKLFDNLDKNYFTIWTNVCENNKNWSWGELHREMMIKHGKALASQLLRMRMSRKKRK